MNRTLGFAALAGFLGCVIVANYAIGHWGTVTFPGGPHTVTVWHWTAPSGVLVVGASFTFRDVAQYLLGRPYRWAIPAAIVAGAVLSGFVADPHVAFASGVAFALGEGLDWTVYTPLAEHGYWTAALVASNTVGSFVDSVVFLWIAFHSLTFLGGQFALKTLMILPAVALLAPWRLRRAVLARYRSAELAEAD